MKRTKLYIAFALSAVIAYVIMEGIESQAPSPRTGFGWAGELVFAVGGKVPEVNLDEAQEIMRGLAAEHCSKSKEDFPIRAEVFKPVAGWANFTTSVVYCPDTGEESKETLHGFIGRCTDRGMELYFHPGDLSPEKMQGCLVVAGAANIAVMDGTRWEKTLKSGETLRMAFGTAGTAFLWIERQDATGGSVDVIVPAEGR